MRAEALYQVIYTWLLDESGRLRDAVAKTVESGRFSRADIVHQLRWIREKCTIDTLEHWQKQNPSNKEPKTVLMLHAGNLPLVEFQDVVAIMLSGHGYIGKISRKSPYLISSLLDYLQKAAPEQVLSFDTQPEHLAGFKTDAVVFSGSADSVPSVNEWLKQHALIHEQSRFLIREAQCSIAFIPQFTDEAKSSLTEAILRFDGAGCRSVRIVVSPESVMADSCHFTDYVESFWLKSGTHRALSPKNEIRFAYNKALGIKQLLLEHLIIQESEPELQAEDVIFWVRGNETKVAELKARYGNMVQCVYAPSGSSLEMATELLERAQWPNLDWKPDGIDLLNWLTTL